MAVVFQHVFGEEITLHVWMSRRPEIPLRC
jgi:hypothetical protein